MDDLKPCPACGLNRKRVFPVVSLEKSSLALRCFGCGYYGEWVAIDITKPAQVADLINLRLKWNATPRPVRGVSYE